MKIYDLKTDGETEPLGLGTALPSFSWKIDGEGVYQRRYRIAVASRPELLERGDPDLWDSGDVESDSTLYVRYGGKALADRTKYYWQVCVNGVYSPVASFETAYLGEAMPYAKWIGMPLAYHGATDVVRLDLAPKGKVVKARLYLAALGCYRLYLNGKLLSDTFFDGAISVYNKHIYYRTYALDIREGQNALCVEIGYGFYGAKKCKAEVVLTYEDGREEVYSTIAGRVWNVARGKVSENSIYGGEVYDNRISDDIYSPDVYPDTSVFVAAYCTDAPAGKLVACPIPAMKVTKVCDCTQIGKFGNTLLIDAHKNICGRLNITVRGERGAKVRINYAEILGGDGRINRANLRTACNRDEYILSGEGEENYAACFTYHGFRYAEITCEGAVEILGVKAEQMRTGVEKCGKFTSSCDTLIGLHNMAALTEGNNLNGVFTDCPQRDERLGWLNDMASRIYESVCNFALDKFLPNFVDMITDTQNADGSFGDTVPFSVGSEIADAVDAYPVLGWMAYKMYGDKDVLLRNYDGFCRWNDKLSEYEHGGVMMWEIYGDWCPAFEFSRGGDGTHTAQTADRFMGAISYIWNIKLTADIAAAIGKTDDAAMWRKKYAGLKKAFFKKYYNADSGKLGNGSQTEYAIGITVFDEEKEMCSAWAREAAEDIRRRGYHTTCGNLGYRHLFYRLSEYGYADTLYKLLTNPEYPGWGYMLKCGATTVWERWEADVGTDMHSFNHPMFAAYDGFLYNYVAGIRTEECEDAFKKIVIKPCFIEGLGSAGAELDTVRGKIRSSWRRDGGKIILDISTPANTECVIVARGKKLVLGGKTYNDEINVTNGTFSVEIKQ